MPVPKSQNSKESHCLRNVREALQKPGFFKEFLGGQVSRAGKRIKIYVLASKLV
jgi:hypothetical protein